MSRQKGKPEREVQAEIKQVLQLYGWFVIRHQQGLGCHPGLSDLTAIKNGRTVYIEVKAEFGGKVSDVQENFRRNIELHGGKYYIARSLDDVRELWEA